MSWSHPYPFYLSLTPVSPLSSLSLFPMSSHLLILCHTEFNQDNMCDHWFGTIHWNLVASLVDIQLKTLTSLSQNLATANRLVWEIRSPWVPLPFVTNFLLLPQCWLLSSLEFMVTMVVPSLDDCSELFSGIFMLPILSSTVLFRKDSFGRGQTHKWSECEHQVTIGWLPLNRKSLLPSLRLMKYHKRGRGRKKSHKMWKSDGEHCLLDEAQPMCSCIHCSCAHLHYS